MSDPVLTRQDRDSAPWLKLKKHLEARLQKLREFNDRDMAKRKRGRLIGRIEEVKALLALDSDAPPVQVDEAELFKD